MKRALVASLAVNLLIAGSVIGHRHFDRHGGRHYGRGGSAEFGIMGFAKSLGEDRRKIITEALRAERPDFRAMREEVRKARLAAGDVLMAEPFDKETARAALSRIGEADGRLKNAGVAAIVTAAEKMTLEERRSLVAWWKERRPHHFSEIGDGERSRRARD